MKKYIIIVLLVLCISSSMECKKKRKRSVKRYSEEEFYALLENKELDRNGKDYNNILNEYAVHMTLLQSLFNDRKSVIDRVTYKRLLVGINQGMTEVPPLEDLKKYEEMIARGEKEEGIDYRIHKLMGKYLRDARPDIQEVTLDIVYDDLFNYKLREYVFSSPWNDDDENENGTDL